MPVDFFAQTELLMLVKERLSAFGPLLCFRVFAAYQRIIAVYSDPDHARQALTSLELNDMPLLASVEIYFDDVCNIVKFGMDMNLFHTFNP